MKNPTKTLWILKDEINIDYPKDHTYSVSCGDELIMDDDRYNETAPTKEIAAFIVHAVNNHESLIEALIDMLENGDDMSRVKALKALHAAGVGK